MKLIRHRGIFKSFLLVFWTFNFVSTAESRTHLINVKVGVFLDRRSHRETSLLENIDERNHNKSLTKITLQTILLHGLSFEEISKTFCSDVLESNVTVIILHTRNGKLARFVANLASHFNIPVIGSINQAPLLSDKVGEKK